MKTIAGSRKATAPTVQGGFPGERRNAPTRVSTAQQTAASRTARRSPLVESPDRKEPSARTGGGKRNRAPVHSRASLRGVDLLDLQIHHHPEVIAGPLALDRRVEAQAGGPHAGAASRVSAGTTDEHVVDAPLVAPLPHEEVEVARGVGVAVAPGEAGALARDGPRVVVVDAAAVQ